MKRLNLSVFLLLVCIIIPGSISAQDDTAPTVVNDILLGDTQIRPNFRVKQILIHRNHRWAMEYDSDLKRLESIPNIKEKKDEIRKLLEAQSQEFRSLSDEYKEVVLQQALLGNSGSYPDCYVYLSNRPNDKSENKDYYIDLVQCVIYSTNKKIERNEMQKGSLGGYDAYQYKFPFPVYVKGVSDEIIKNAKDHRASMVTAVVDLDLEDFLKSYIPNPDTLTVKGFRNILLEVDNFMRIVDNGNNNVLTKSGAKYQNTAYYKKLINKLADTGDAWALEMAGRADELVDRYEKAAKAGDMDAALQVYYKKGIEEGYPLIKELLQRDWSSLKWSRKIGYTEYQGYPALINSLSVDLQKKNPELDFDLNKTMWEEKKLYRCGLETGSAYEEGKGTTKNPQKAFALYKAMQQQLNEETDTKTKDYYLKIVKVRLSNCYWLGSGTVANKPEAAKLIVDVVGKWFEIPDGLTRNETCSLNYRLGYIHEMGMAGVLKNIDEAWGYYKKAYGNGAFGWTDSPEGAFKMAYWTEKGRGYYRNSILKIPDLDMARQLYRYAYEYGNPALKQKAKAALNRLGN